MLNGIKWCAVFPSHFDDTREIGRVGWEKRRDRHFCSKALLNRLSVVEMALVDDKSISIMISALQNNQAVLRRFINQTMLLIYPPRPPTF